MTDMALCKAVDDLARVEARRVDALATAVRVAESVKGEK